MIKGRSKVNGVEKPKDLCKKKKKAKRDEVKVFSCPMP